MRRYRLEVTAHGKPGFYESGSLLGLVLTRLKHNITHFLKDGKWVD